MIVLGILALVFSELAWASRVDVEEDRADVLDSEEERSHTNFAPVTRSHARKAILAELNRRARAFKSSSSEDIPQELPEVATQAMPTDAGAADKQELEKDKLQGEVERLQMEKEALKLRQEVAELEAAMPAPTTTTPKPQTSRPPSKVAATRRIKVTGQDCPAGLFMTPLEYGAYLGDRSLRQIPEETFKEMNKDAKTPWDCFLLLQIFGITNARARPLGLPFLPEAINTQNEQLMWDNLLFILEQGAQPNRMYDGLFTDQTAQENAGQIPKDKLEAMFATLADATGLTSGDLAKAFDENGDLRKLVISRD